MCAEKRAHPASPLRRRPVPYPVGRMHAARPGDTRFQATSTCFTTRPGWKNGLLLAVDRFRRGHRVRRVVEQLPRSARPDVEECIYSR